MFREKSLWQGKQRNSGTTCRNAAAKSIVNAIKSIYPKWQYWSDIWHSVFLVDSLGDLILMSLETFTCQESCLCVPLGMMLIWLGKWQSYQLCIRWVWEGSIFANQMHPTVGWEIDENSHFNYRFLFAPRTQECFHRGHFIKKNMQDKNNCTSILVFNMGRTLIWFVRYLESIVCTLKE